MENVPFDIQNYKGQMLGTRPDGYPVYIGSNYNGTIDASITEANGHNVFSTIFGDFIVGTRIPLLANAFNEGIPITSMLYDMTGSSFVYIDEFDFGRGLEKTNVLINSSGATAGSTSYIRTQRRLRYLPGHESYAYFTLRWDNVAEGTVAYGGLFDDDDGYMVGFVDGVFSYIRRRAGQDTVIQHSEFNGLFDFSNFDETKMNIFAIKFGYLGVAPIEIYMFDPEAELTVDGKMMGMGKFKIIHQEKYTGTDANPHVVNANLPLAMYVDNGTTTSDVAMGTGSIEMGNINGHNTNIDPASRDGIYVRKQFTTTGTSFNIVAFRNALEVEMIDSLLPNGDTGTSVFKNTITALLKEVTIVNDGSAAVNVDLYIFSGDDITNTPTWNKDNRFYSVLEYSTDITVNLANATLLTTFALNKVDKVVKDVRINDFLLYPNQYAIFVATSKTAMNNTMTFINAWEEQF